MAWTAPWGGGKIRGVNRIKLLSEQVANQIAAGEVVERPASVVKELVENALDAGAKKITVEVKAGGRSLIRVTDDGHGMSRDDALMSLERHATSKISRAEDLASITTMGFRGEAVPSIASVSRFMLTTREADSETTTQIIINGGKIWSSQAHRADWMLLLTRTDPDAPKHRGISFFLMDMKDRDQSIVLVDQRDTYNYVEVKI